LTDQKIKYFKPFISRGYHKKFDIYFYDNDSGKRKKKATKTASQEAAIRILNKFKQSYLSNIHTVEISTIGQLKDVILKYNARIYSKKTLEMYRISLEGFIRIIGEKPLGLVTFNDFEYYKSERIKFVTETTVNINLRTIKAAMNYAKNSNAIDINPGKRVKLFNIPEKKRLYFTDEQIETLIKVIADIQLVHIVKFGLHTGCRLGEIVNLQWKDINFEKEVINIINKENFLTKTRKERSIPCSKYLFNILNELAKVTDGILLFRHPDDYIFNRNGIQFKADYISKQFKKAIRQANLEEKFHFHVLRHTFITNLVKKNININYIQRLAGHTELKTTIGYIHLQTEDLRSAVNSLNYGI